MTAASRVAPLELQRSRESMKDEKTRQQRLIGVETPPRRLGGAEASAKTGFPVPKRLSLSLKLEEVAPLQLRGSRTAEKAQEHAQEQVHQTTLPPQPPEQPSRLLRDGRVVELVLRKHF